MKRFVIAFLILGGVIPVVLLAGQEVLLRTDPESISRFRALWYYVWPTAVFLMAAAGAGPAGKLLIVAVSVVGNIVVYGIIGMIVAIMRTLLVRLPRGRGQSSAQHR